MKKRLLFLMYCIFFLHAHSQVNIQWQKRYSSPGANSDKAEDMVMDASGNIYITGIGKGSSGSFDYITVKYNAAGVQQWIAEYNGPGNGMDEAHAITIDASGNNVYVTGWSWGDSTTGFDYATVKYNAAGVKQWSVRYNNTGINGTDEAFDIGVDNSGNVYVAGSSEGSPGSSAAAVIKYNASGIQQIVKRYTGSGGNNGANAIHVSSSGNVYITGYAYQGSTSDYNFLTIRYNSSLTQKWAAQYNGPASKFDEARAMAVDASGNVYVTGCSQMSGSNNYDYSIVKYDSVGNPKWTRNYNGNGNDYDRANAIKLDVSGDIYMTGKSIGPGMQLEDVLTLKYDKLGNLKWATRYNGPTSSYDEGKALFVDAAKNTYVTGFTHSAGFGNDYLTLKYDSTGVQKWVTTYNGTASNADQSSGVLVDNAGDIYITGSSKGNGSAEDYETIKYCQFTADAGKDKFICPGASVSLNVVATGAVSYSWSPAAGLSNPSVANPIASPGATTTYVVAVTNASGCVDLDTVMVTIVPLPTPGITPDGPTVFCAGNSVTLTSVPAPFYKWNTSPVDTLQTITVNKSGTYIITIRNNIGCSGTASLDIHVNPLPVVDAGTTSSICYGTTKQLNASGAISYRWSPGKMMNDSTIYNPVASPSSTTTFIVTGTDGNGCSNKDSVKITVLPAPVINAGADTSICKNTSLQLHASAGYSFYNWHPGTLLNDSTIADPMFMASSSVNYTVTVTDANGCFNSDSIKLTALPLPVIEAGPDISVCKNSLVTFVPTGGASYVWHPGKLLSDSTATNPVFTAVSSATFTVTGTSNNGCKNNDVLIVNTLPLPAIPTITVKADTLFCNNGYASYQWFLNTISIPGATKAFYNYSSNGTYQVAVSDNNGCSVHSDAVQIVVGIPENGSFADIRIFPNPTTTFITLQLELLKTRNVKVSILNASGQKVYADEWIQVSGNISKQIDLKEYAAGAYYLQLVTDEALINRKILKQ